MVNFQSNCSNDRESQLNNRGFAFTALPDWSGVQS